MTRTTILWGESRDRPRRWSRFVGGYFVGLLSVFFLAYVSGQLGYGEFGYNTLYNGVLPVLMFLLPPLLSALNATRGGGLLLSLALGITPIVAFGLMVIIAETGTQSGPQGDMPLSPLLGMFAVVTVGGALVGFVVAKAFAARI